MPQPCVLTGAIPPRANVHHTLSPEINSLIDAMKYLEEQALKGTPEQQRQAAAYFELEAEYLARKFIGAQARLNVAAFTPVNAEPFPPASVVSAELLN